MTAKPGWRSIVAMSVLSLCNVSWLQADGRRACASDCNDANGAIWSTPGEATNIVFTSKTALTWVAPVDLGGTSVVYDVVRSTSPSTFEATGTCVESNDGSDTQATDAGTPARRRAARRTSTWSARRTAAPSVRDRGVACCRVREESAIVRAVAKRGCPAIPRPGSE